MLNGQKIIEGLKQAVAGDFARVTVAGQTWVRLERQERKMADKTIEGVAERADFGPAYNGEDYVTMTFRVPKDTRATPGIWDLTPREAGQPDWAKQKNPPEEPV